jgi:hypothetical protein
MSEAQNTPQAELDSHVELTTEWLTTVFGQILRVSPSQLLITPEGQARMKVLAGQHEVAFFPETAWQGNQQQQVVVDALIDGRLRVVNSDENLLRLMRWTHPMGLNVPRVPVWFMNSKTTPVHRPANG